MTIAQGSRYEISYVKEVVHGTTPVSPAMKRLRSTGGGMNMAKESFQSAELRSDRQLVSLRHTTRSIAGAVPFELSYTSFDDILENALFGTWTSNILKAGVTPSSFSIERRYLDISQFLLYTGCMVNTLSLSIPASGGVTGSFDFVGRNMSTSTTTVGAPTDVALTDPFTSDGGVIQEGGATVAFVTGLELSLTNNISPNYAVGSNFSREQTYGRSILTGTVTAFFENLTLLNKFINETESSITVTLTDPAANDLTISIPRIKYTGGEVPVEGEGSVTLSLPFQALRDPVQGTNIVITR